MLGRSRKKTPVGRAIDISITVFLVAAIIYLARDMLRSGRFTFLKFAPTYIEAGRCRLSPPSKDMLKAWGVLVRNSKKSNWQKVMEQGGGEPALVLKVKGEKGEVTLSFFPLTRGAYFVARKGKEELVFQLDDWTYNMFMKALQESCEGVKNGD